MDTLLLEAHSPMAVRAEVGAVYWGLCCDSGGFDAVEDGLLLRMRPRPRLDGVRSVAEGCAAH